MMKNVIIILGIILLSVNGKAQCPTVYSCPSNISVNNNPGSCGAIVNYTPPFARDTCNTNLTSVTFNHTGAMQTFTVPVGITRLTFQVFGAQGGSNAGGIAGGLGGSMTITRTVTPGSTYYIYVGGMNGYNGGGLAGAQSCSASQGGNGGGASDVRSSSWGGLASRFVIAGGGGGAGGNRNACGRGSGGGGGGGYFGGGGGAGWPASSTILPTGGSQYFGGVGGTTNYSVGTNGTAGTLGLGGNGGIEVMGNQSGSALAISGGVGGGNTGGIGQYAGSWTGQSGAGGSSYFNGVASVGSVVTNSGVRIGDGQVIVSYIDFTLNITQISGLSGASLFPIGVTTNTFVASNSFGADTCSFTVTVTDNQQPIITCPGTSFLNTDVGGCTSSGSIGTATGTDNCTGLLITNNAPSVFPIGNTTVVWSAKDASNNTATCSQVVHVTDAGAPSISCPSNITQNNDSGQCGAAVTYTTPVGTDACTSVTTARTSGLASGAVFPIGSTTVSYTVTDAAYNTSSCSFTVTIIDNEAPVLTCPAALTINTDAGLCTSSTSIGMATATDNCSTPTITNNAPSVFPIGLTTVTWTATDSVNNSTTCTQLVTVVDMENPTISCPSNITVNSDSGNCGAVVTYSAPVGADNCTSVTTNLLSGLSSGSTFPVGVSTVWYKAIDGVGNSDSCSFTVTVIDNENPSITCLGNITVNNDSGMCDAIVTYTAPVGTDNCSGVTTTLTSGLASGATFPVGVTNVTYTVTDSANNIDSCTFTVTVLDTELPMISCGTTINSCDSVVVFTAPIGSDNCSGAITVMTEGLISGSVFPIGTTTNKYVVADVAGNKDSCSFDVVRNPLPIVKIEPFNPDTVCKQLASFVLPVGTPSSGIYSGNGVVGTTFSPSAAGVGTHYIVYSFTDSNSCFNSDSSRIVVNACLSVEENNTLEGVRIFPNPTNGLITIELNKMSGPISYSLSSLEGKVIQSKNNLSKLQFKVSLENQSNGTYILQINDGKLTKSFMIIKD